MFIKDLMYRKIGIHIEYGINLNAKGACFKADFLKKIYLNFL